MEAERSRRMVEELVIHSLEEQERELHRLEQERELHKLELEQEQVLHKLAPEQEQEQVLRKLEPEQEQGIHKQELELEHHSLEGQKVLSYELSSSSWVLVDELYEVSAAA